MRREVKRWVRTEWGRVWHEI